MSDCLKNLIESSYVNRGFHNSATMWVTQELKYNKKNAIDELTELIHQVNLLEGKVSVGYFENLLYVLSYVERSFFNDHYQNADAFTLDVIRYGLNYPHDGVVDATIGVMESWDISKYDDIRELLKNAKFKSVWLERYRIQILEESNGEI